MLTPLKISPVEDHEVRTAVNCLSFGMELCRLEVIWVRIDLALARSRRERKLLSSIRMFYTVV